MPAFSKFVPLLMGGLLKDIPRHSSARLKKELDENGDQRFKHLLRQTSFQKDLALCKTSLDSFILYMGLSQTCSNYLPKTQFNLNLKHLPHDFFHFKYKENADEDEEPPCDNDLDSVVTSLESLHNEIIQLQNLANQTRQIETSLRIFQLNWFPVYDDDKAYLTECFKGQRDLPFKSLVYSKSGDLSVTECFFFSRKQPWGTNFEKDAKRIVDAAQKFARDLSNKLVAFTNYLIDASTDGRFLDMLIQAAKDVTLVVKKLLFALGNMINKILNVIASITDVSKQTALRVAETCSDCTQSTSKEFMDESQTLKNVGQTLQSVAPSMGSSLKKGINTLQTMRNSVEGYGQNLQNEGNLAMAFVRSALKNK